MELESQSHVKWTCKYHVIITPKYRKKILYGRLKKKIGEILRELAERKKIEIIEGHAMPDHIHIALSIPPKYSVASVIGYMKGKSAILIHEKKGEYKGYWGKNFWSRGYYVSTMGLDEKTVREYIKKQEYLDKKADKQMHLGY